MHDDLLSSCFQDLGPSLLRASLVLFHFYQSRSFEVWYKKKQGPCSTADISTNKILKQELSFLFPEAGWLSEESADDQRRLDLPYVWIVDPIDGTRDFIKGSSEFSISVALVKNGLPVLGGIALPAKKEIIIGSHELGMKHWIYEEPNEKIDGFSILDLSRDLFYQKVLARVSWKAKQVQASQCTNIKEAKILVSRSEWRKKKLGPIQEDFNCVPGSSIARKLALLALGEGDLVVSVFPKHEWDIAGGAALMDSHLNHSIYELQSMQKHSFNCHQTRSYGLVAGPNILVDQFLSYWKEKKLQVFQNFN